MLDGRYDRGGVRLFRRNLLGVNVLVLIVLSVCLVVSVWGSVEPSGSLPLHDISNLVPPLLLEDKEELECRAAERNPASDVIQLTDDNFEELVKPEETWLVELYVPTTSSR